MNVHQLRRRWKPIKERLAAERADHPTSIRFHRACSWLQRVERMDEDDLDMKLTCQWIAFNALAERCSPRVFFTKESLSTTVGRSRRRYMASRPGRNHGQGTLMAVMVAVVLVLLILWPPVLKRPRIVAYKPSNDLKVCARRIGIPYRRSRTAVAERLG